MDLYIIRHADASPLGEAGATTDAERPLTELGHAQSRRVADGFKKHGIAIDIVLTSPLLRSRQTAEVIAQHCPETAPEVRICEELTPGSKPRKLAKALGGITADSIAIVGHQPDLSMFAGWLIGDRKVQIELAKAGVAYLQCSPKPGKRSAALNWLVTVELLASS